MVQVSVYDVATVMMRHACLAEMDKLYVPVYAITRFHTEAQTHKRLAPRCVRQRAALR